MQTADVLEPVISQLNLKQIWAKRFKSDQPFLSDQDALNHLLKVVHIERAPGTTIFRITAQSEVPQESADIANAIAEHYKALRDDEEAHRTQRGLDSLRDQIADQQKVVAAEKDEEEKLRLVLGSPSVTLQPDENLSTRFHTTQRELAQAQALLDALNNRVKEVIDSKLTASPVRIISRAVAPPE